MRQILLFTFSFLLLSCSREEIMKTPEKIPEPIVYSISAPDSYSIDVGESKKILASIVPSNATTGFTYTSSSNNIFKIDADKIVGISSGTANMTIYHANHSLSKVVQVTVNGIKASQITLSTNVIGLRVNENYTISPRVFPTNTTSSVIWKSSDDNVATVINGVVNTKKNGKTVITATIDDVKAECIVSVGEPSSNIIGGLVHYWGFENTIVDYVDSTTDLKSRIVNRSFIPDRKNIGNSAFNFTSKQGLYTSSRYGPEVYTISLWVKATKGGTILNFFDNRFGDGIPYADDSNLTISSTGISFTQNTKTSNGVININVINAEVYNLINAGWYNIVLVHDSTNYIGLYINGKYVAGKTYLPGIFTSFVSDRSYFKLGDDKDGMTGAIDDVAIWNKKLSDSDILELYNSQK